MRIGVPCSAGQAQSASPAGAHAAEQGSYWQTALHANSRRFCGDGTVRRPWRMSITTESSYRQAVISSVSWRCHPLRLAYQYRFVAALMYAHLVVQHEPAGKLITSFFDMMNSLDIAKFEPLNSQQIVSIDETDRKSTRLNS